MTKVKGTEVVLVSFQERLKSVLENMHGPRREGEKPIADLLFQFMEEITGYLDVAVMHVDKFRPDSSSPHSARMPSSSSSPKVVSILGKVDGVPYYCRKGELCEPHHMNIASHSAYQRVRVVPMCKVSDAFAYALVGEMIKNLEHFVFSDHGPVPQPCNGFVVRYSIRSSDGSMKKWKFAFIEKGADVQNYEQATAVFSLRQKTYAAQKKLQRMEDIMIYAGQWISVPKNLSKEVSVMDMRIGGITPTELGVNEQSESATV